MPETDVTLIVAALLVELALFAVLGGRWLSRRLGAVGQQLRGADELLVRETPLLVAHIRARRSEMAALSAATERALWSLARFDERLDTARAGLSERRVALDDERTRLIAARATFARAKRGALMLMRVLELRRAILG